jgi:hypothetical protein
MHGFYARTGPIRRPPRATALVIECNPPKADIASTGKDRAMRLTIEIVAAALLVFCITASSAAFAAGKPGRSADGLSCSFSVPANASPAARCAAIKRQCGGKFYANYCGDKLLSAM